MSLLDTASARFVVLWMYIEEYTRSSADVLHDVAMRYYGDPIESLFVAAGFAPRKSLLAMWLYAALVYPMTIALPVALSLLPYVFAMAIILGVFAASYWSYYNVWASGYARALDHVHVE